MAQETSSKVMRSALGVLEANGELRLRERDHGFILVARPKAHPCKAIALLNPENAHWKDPRLGTEGKGYFTLMRHVGMDPAVALDAYQGTPSQRKR